VVLGKSEDFGKYSFEGFLILHKRYFSKEFLKDVFNEAVIIIGKKKLRVSFSHSVSHISSTLYFFRNVQSGAEESRPELRRNWRVFCQRIVVLRVLLTILNLLRK
jgi:hypothetical protein